ncbi:MAG: hypothetical protein AB1592_18895 [Pseudomonadota bacterium]
MDHSTQQARPRRPRVRRTPPPPDLNIQFRDWISPEWDGIWTNGRYLFLPGWRAGFEPEELRVMFYRVQTVGRLERDLRQAQEEVQERAQALFTVRDLLREAQAKINALTARNDTLERQAEWFRREIRAAFSCALAGPDVAALVRPAA